MYNTDYYNYETIYQDARRQDATRAERLRLWAWFERFGAMYDDGESFAGEEGERVYPITNIDGAVIDCAFEPVNNDVTLARDWFDEVCDWLPDCDDLRGVVFQLTAYENGWAVDVDAFIRDQVKVALAEMDDDALARVNNGYSTGGDGYNYDGYIYDNLDEMLEGVSPWDAVNMCHFGEYHGGAYGYYKYNGYGNIEENYPRYMVDFGELASFIIEDESIAPSDEVRAVLQQLTIKYLRGEEI